MRQKCIEYKMCFDEICNFCLKHFSKFLIFLKLNMKNMIFMSFSYSFYYKIKFAPTFTIIFVISASKYVSIHSFKKNGGNRFSELHPHK